MKELSYYFKHIDEFSEKDIFKDTKFVWEPLNKLDNYLSQKVVSKNLKINNATTGEFCCITGNYIIGEGTKIGANTTIEGPVIIGKNVTIQSGALIRPGTIIGDNVVIGHGCEAKHSIIQNNAKVQSFTFCGDSIIGKSSRIGSGTILANRRFDQKNIQIKENEEKYDTNLQFFGAIIGDSSRLGANCTTSPGTCVGSYTWVLPGIKLWGFIPEEKRLIPQKEYIVTDNPKVELK
ncbi:MAG: glucose-1-phosphate thymidylyltransferase [Bacilli bacterium]|nr:glucose-1-phosphate thymidylyltransferase [Bacilli bacterium]